MWFGIGPQGQAMFGLPGNPVSTLVCLIRYVIPAIAEAMGTRRIPPERLALAAPVDFQHALTYFLPVSIEHDDWGRPWAIPGHQRFRGLPQPGRHRWLRRTAARPQHLCQGLRDQRLPLVT
jgi:molybdopterin biosynthesis enzyme